MWEPSLWQEDKEAAGGQMVVERLRDEISPQAKDDMTT